MEMKKCKECGKLFTPKNSRSQYCDDKHYRPCPVCGKSIEIKYLSDPTPRCADCRKAGLKLGSKIKYAPAPATSDSDDSLATIMEYHIMRYTGRLRSCGFEPGHDYVVRVTENRPYGNLVEAIKDVTTDDDISISLPIVNMSSYHYFFKSVLKEGGMIRNGAKKS